ncbi:MAG: hypothetical protein Q4E65_07305 [Clostridia bacterium]|nr:hypothetical protein [Clostridia bacterium]
MEQRQPKAPPIGREQAAQALHTLKLYKAGKANLERRIVENESWWRLRHWEQMRTGAGDEPEPASAWLQNCIANKHADAMDKYPAPFVMPREPDDAAAAHTLSSILPVVLEQNDYEQVYSDMWWYKLKNGTGVTGVFWNPEKNGGRGEVDVRQLDLLNLFWEPGVKDIQASANFFSVELADKDYLLSRYPQIPLTGSAMDVTQYVYDDAMDTSGKIAVIDWYYKRRQGARTVLHYAKLACGEVLYATQNDPLYANRGFYDHGAYPFVFDALFPEEGAPVGYGYVDICKNPQTQIDRLNQALLKNAVMAARPRWFVRGDGSINEEEYADWSRDFVHYHGSGTPRENISQVEVRTLPDVYIAILNGKINELKETSGNRDFNQGSSASGVTAASAIAALQEAGSKLSRDMIKGAYRAYARMCYIVIELIRQFYDTPRCFRITGTGGEAGFARCTNAALRPHGANGALAGRLPVFDVHVRPATAGAYSRVSQNELAIQLYQAGFFDPARAQAALTALGMMDFEGKEQTIREVQKQAAETADKLRLAGRMAEQKAGGGLTKGADADLRRAADSAVTAQAREKAEVRLS